jgi:hypothetical protein
MRRMSAQPPPLELRIEELVVTGFPLEHPERLAPAVESALGVRLAGTPVAGGPAFPSEANVSATHELEMAGVDELADAVALALDAAIRERFGGAR